MLKVFRDVKELCFDTTMTKIKKQHCYMGDQVRGVKARKCVKNTRAV